MTATAAVSTLRLFLTESDLQTGSAAELEWRLLDGPTAGRGRNTMGELPVARRLEVFLPPSLVLRTAVTLPPGAKRQARRLLAHALDTVLLGDPESQQLAYTFHGDRCHVAAIAQSRLDVLLKALAGAGRRATAIYAADMLIAANGHTLLWYFNGWARRVGEEAFWVDADSPVECPPLLTMLTQGADSLLLAVAGDQGDTVRTEQWRAATEADISVANGDPLAAPLAADAINLLQGEYAAGPQLDIDLSKLKPAGILTGAALALAALGWYGQWWSWHKEEKALKQGMTAAFAAAFPGTPVVDAQLQLQAKLKSGAAPAASDPVARLVALAPQFASSGDVKLIGLEYADGRINADYKAKPEQTAALVQNLGKLGQVNTTPAADRVRITLIPRQ